MAATTLSIGTIWDRTSDFLSDHWRPAALISLATIGANDVLASSLQPGAPQQGDLGRQLAVFLIALGGALWALVGQLAVTAFAFDPARGMGPAFATGLRRLPALVVAILIIALASALLAAPLIGGIVFGSVNLASQPPIVPGWVALYMLLLGLASIAIWARLILMAPLVARGCGGPAAITASFRRTRGHFWRIFGAVLLYLILFLIVTAAARLASGALFALILGAGAHAASAVTTGIVTGSISMVALVFIVQLHRQLVPQEPVA